MRACRYSFNKTWIRCARETIDYIFCFYFAHICICIELAEQFLAIFSHKEIIELEPCRLYLVFAGHAEEAGNDVVILVDAVQDVASSAFLSQERSHLAFERTPGNDGHMGQRIAHEGAVYGTDRGKVRAGTDVQACFYGESPTKYCFSF